MRVIHRRRRRERSNRHDKRINHLSRAGEFSRRVPIITVLFTVLSDLDVHLRDLGRLELAHGF